MKISKINLLHLRNDEHFQFNAEFCTLVNKAGAEALGIKSQYESYLPLYEQEADALKKVMKSAITAEIQEADKRRDLLFRGMVDSNNAALLHFNPEKQAAARRLKILFDTYGNLAQKPLNEETSAIHNLLDDLDLAGNYAADAAAVGLTDWQAELGAANEAFSQLMQGRYEETALRTDLVLKQVRRQVDEAYRTMAGRINALVVVNGAAAYSDFIRNLNAVVDKYAQALAKRSGRKTKTVES